jgi:bis(5'-nucleosyl)-tetraphosphatase (symmetrical)
MRWLVGDVQGCVRELEGLVETIRFDPARDELWSLGDLVNRGPESLAVLRLWRDVGGRGILGNHDIYALRAHADPRRRKRDSLDALFEAEDGPKLLDRLRERPVLVRLPATGPGRRDVWIVHAGLHPRWTDLEGLAERVNGGTRDEAWLTSPEVAFATRVRCCSEAGEQCRHSGPPELCPEPFKPWDAFYRGSELVVHGHWAMRGYYRGERTMGLDSGCVYGGCLTAWCQDEDRIVQIRSTRLRP